MSDETAAKSDHAPASSGNAPGGSDDASADVDAAMDEESPDDDRETPAGVDRFRAGAIGSGLGGFLLIATGLLLPYAAAAAVVLLTGALAVVFRRGSPGFGVGIAAIGLVAAVEATPGLGLGLDALALGALAVVFALVDAGASRVMARVESRD